MTRGRTALLVVLVLLGAVLVVVGLGQLGGPTTVPTTSAPSSPAPSSTAPSSAPSVQVPSSASPAPAAVSAPVRVRVQRLGIDSRLDRLHLEASGELEKPPHWQVAGWYADGPRPGQTGPAVIAGHVDSPTGPAVFARLAELRVGDVVTVDGASGHSVSFRVDRTRMVRKDAFPTRAVYGPTPDAQLRLITCDGPYVDRSGGYQDNLVVFATRLPT